MDCKKSTHLAVLFLFPALSQDWRERKKEKKWELISKKWKYSTGIYVSGWGLKWNHLIWELPGYWWYWWVKIRVNSVSLNEIFWREEKREISYYQIKSIVWFDMGKYWVRLEIVHIVRPIVFLPSPREELTPGASYHIIMLDLCFLSQAFISVAFLTPITTDRSEENLLVSGIVAQW